MSFDRRTTPANDRVVADWLADRFPDRRPVRPEPRRITRPVVDLALEPGGPRTRQLLYGTCFEVLERRDGQAFGLARGAVYVGWLDEAALGDWPAEVADPRWVASRQTHAYAAPDLKSPEQAALSHLSRLEGGATEGAFTRTELGWVPTSHLGPPGGTDPVAEALRLLGTPYLWGGNSCWGIDCSGLVQSALMACGIDCPGDSDLQRAAFLEEGREGPFEPGELLFWPGHVAMAMDAERMIHANAHAMAVTIEPIVEARARIEAKDPFLGRGRPD